MRRIGILTGGGDAPGLNAVIRAVVRTALNEYDIEVIGIFEGFNGLLDPVNVKLLGREDVRGILSRGGTILGAANRGNPFARPETHDGVEVIVDVSDELVRNIERLELEAVIVVGGDGTMRCSYDLIAKGAPIIGVPKTIDNDMGGTDVTFGFDTALDTATEALDRLHTTAESHHRVMLLELMGRDAGWIALGAGIAGGADAILIPEIPFQLESVLDRIHQREQRGHPFSIIAVAEGARPHNGEQVFRLQADRQRVARLGGICQQVAEELSARTHLETRFTILGHLQRGGQPSPFDRWLATRYGAAAVRLAAEGEHGTMVSYRGREITSISIADALAETPKLVDPSAELVQTARGLGIEFGEPR